MFDKLTIEAAEIAGIFAADGYLNKNYICFWGSIYEDKEHYDKIIKILFRKAFNIEINPHEKKSNSVYGFYVCNKSVIKYFNEFLGFKFGKKTYDVSIPKCIMESDDINIISSFIRGYFDADGYLNFDKKNKNKIHTYPRIGVSSASFKMIKDISKLLKRLEINYNIYTLKAKKPNENDQRKLSVLGHNMLKKWMGQIGFNNPSKISRYEIFKRYGFVPSNTSLSERRKILEGNLNPWDFYVGSVAQLG